MLTSQQIVTLACQATRSTGYVSQAGQFLNSILADLAQQYDFEANKQTYNFNFTPGISGPFPLPANFLRVQRDGAFYTIQGVPYTMIGLDNSEFDQLVQIVGNQAYPSNYTVYVGDQANGTLSNMYVWVQPNGGYPVTIRYYCQPADISTPETSSTVPWFGNQRFLMKKLMAMLCDLADDERATQFDAQADAILEGYLKMKDDAETSQKRVKTDPRFFGVKFNRLPNTKLVGF